MKLTRASTYALQAAAYMAHMPPGKPVASHVIANDRGIPERFLLKVLKPLVTGDIFISIKGPNGGYRLKKPAKEITVLEIVEIVDGPIRGGPPEGAGAGPEKVTKKLTQIFQAANKGIREELQKWNLADVAGKA